MNENVNFTQICRKSEWKDNSDNSCPKSLALSVISKKVSQCCLDPKIYIHVRRLEERQENANHVIHSMKKKLMRDNSHRKRILI